MHDHLPTECRAIYVGADGYVDLERRWDPLRATAILPGAFNPMHAGHWGLGDAATQMLGTNVAFELSIANVDKPPLAPSEIQRRQAQFAGRAALWLTNTPRFAEKAELFPGATFIVGADTAQRVVDARYYEGDTAQMHEALARIRARAARFLVACRIDVTGTCVRLADVPVPPTFHDLFSEIPAELFRLDMSSSELRQCAPDRTLHRSQ
jgi:hypothetical protein